MLILGCVCLVLGVLFIWIAPKQKGESGEYSGYLKLGQFFLLLSCMGFAAYFEQNLALAWFGVLCCLWSKVRRARRHDDWQTVYAPYFYPMLVFALVLSFVFRPFVVPSYSMLPTLNKGAYFLAWAHDFQDYRIGDVVVFHNREFGKMVKRIVAVGGDVVEYRDYVLYVNGKQTMQQGKIGAYTFQSLKKKTVDVYVERDYSVLLDKSELSLRRNEIRENAHCAYSGMDVKCVVPQEYYFMVGDNRQNSIDSRYFGAVSAQDIVGKVAFILKH